MSLQKLREFPLACPYCGGQMGVSVYLYEVPYVGPILITVMSCLSCGFRRREVSIAEAGEPVKTKVRVKGEEELRYLVVKSSTASVLIPEMGLEYVPGPHAQGVITTVEGILHEFLGALDVICQEGERCERARRWLEEAIEGKVGFTLIMCDPEGKSGVFGQAERGPMDSECPSLD
ncbi:MAG: ZPR1 zinc finger domain-containing protein [Acidilobaceae archaeon]|nr:ZPR1 zinc finger domain-containing protein [Acidilobaceae archaeon]MCX8165118.1 ZPR1 zinc finger domain-containing protein [Acidilobaceae archaeon]MDW7974366.1 ZPR1 zinc finger domain-containing protein [Sulfolobales archaeon]